MPVAEADPSTGAAIEVRQTRQVPFERRCHAHRKNGDQCRKAAMKGQRVCRSHGGASRHARAKAAERILMSADVAAKHLIGFISDPKVPYTVRLAAARDLLDRADLSGAIKVDLGGGASDSPMAVLLSRIDRTRTGDRPAGMSPEEVARLNREGDRDVDVVDAEIVEESGPAPVQRTANGKRVPAARQVQGEALLTWDEAYGEDTPAARNGRSVSGTRLSSGSFS